MQPFAEFARPLAAASPTRAAITAATRLPEPVCVPSLLHEARLSDAMQSAAQTLARRLVAALRARRTGGAVEGLLQEFSLSSTEGVALMCLAEALLRIPDSATRDLLIRDKISHGDWSAHLGHSPSLFVNAATWGLMLTGKLVATTSEKSLSTALARLIGKGGEPLIRKGVDMAMRVLGEQFVTGETMAEALARSRKFEARGFRYSYDMLGEAATTADDASRYHALYVQAIHAIGQASAGRGIHDGPGISIKLSALHPRYARAQQARVMNELLPAVRELALLAHRYDIGLNIDAEEAGRLELSLDILEALCFEPALAGWNGIGFVVQAYQKRCPFVIDHLVDLARRSGHRLMVRLVKGAYWDSEIKRAQQAGLAGYPVYTRKVHTDVAYLACARRLLAAPEQIYPQFATHNAYTLAAVYQMAGPNYQPGQYEFQCLHGMGEPLYEQVTGALADGMLDRPCRIYAPVGTHETLLAYLVRRLLENGSNTSFVNLIADASVSIDTLVADPVAAAERIAPRGKPHELIPLPVDLYGSDSGKGAGRLNSQGLDLADEDQLVSLSASLKVSADQVWRAWPVLAGDAEEADAWNADRAVAVRNPACRNDVVGEVIEADAAEVERALAAAKSAAAAWRDTPPQQRSRCLEAASDLFEARMPSLLGLIIRESGKTAGNAVGEVREAVDFLRYYAQQARLELQGEAHVPLGPVVCISPWNFPLSIFTGQVAAALAAGNTVLAKPAEQTPLIAAVAVQMLHQAGVPRGALQLLPGTGEAVGAALVADLRVQGVVFTGSTSVARSIARTLAKRLDVRGHAVTLIAETGGQNAMVVDSSALAEQVVADVLQSAFDSAGQRCSALRVLCLQDDIADRTLAMLEGALRELAVGNPDRLATDIGPVIDEEARSNIEKHVAAMTAAGRAVRRQPLPSACAQGTFVAPTLIEIDSIGQLECEVFGPVLHVLRYRRDSFDALLDQLNGTGYGLTFGLHTRMTVDPSVREYANRSPEGMEGRFGAAGRNVDPSVREYANRSPEGIEGRFGAAGRNVDPSVREYANRSPEGIEGRFGAAGRNVDPSVREYANRSPEGIEGRFGAAGRWPSATPSATTIASAVDRIRAGNVYVNRNMIGAVVGVQPFGGEGLSGTGPKAGGPLYLHRLLGSGPLPRLPEPNVSWLLPGPTGERNTYAVVPRGTVLCVAATRAGASAQWAAVRATNNVALWADNAESRAFVLSLPEADQARHAFVSVHDASKADIDAVLFEGDEAALSTLNQQIADRDGPIVGVHALSAAEIVAGTPYPHARLVLERSVSINTAAAGGNASLMTIG